MSSPDVIQYSSLWYVTSTKGIGEAEVTCHMGIFAEESFAKRNLKPAVQFLVSSLKHIGKHLNNRFHHNSYFSKMAFFVELYVTTL